MTEKIQPQNKLTASRYIIIMIAIFVIAEILQTVAFVGYLYSIISVHIAPFIPGFYIVANFIWAVVSGGITYNQSNAKKNKEEKAFFNDISCPSCHSKNLNYLFWVYDHSESFETGSGLESIQYYIRKLKCKNCFSVFWPDSRDEEWRESIQSTPFIVNNDNSSLNGCGVFLLTLMITLLGKVLLDLLYELMLNFFLA